MERPPDEDLDYRFAEFRETLSDHTPPRHVFLDELRAFD